MRWIGCWAINKKERPAGETYEKVCPPAGLLPFGEDARIDKLALIVVEIDADEHAVPNRELCVKMIAGIQAQAGYAVLHGAEDTPSVLAANDSLPPAAGRVPDFRSIRGVGVYLLH